MQEKMRPCLKKNLTGTKAIILMRINKQIPIQAVFWWTNRMQAQQKRF